MLKLANQSTCSHSEVVSTMAFQPTDRGFKSWSIFNSFFSKMLNFYCALPRLVLWMAFTHISKNPFADLGYSTTVTFPLATFSDIFHPFFLILKSAESALSALSHFPFWPASPVLLYIFHVFDTMWWRYFCRSILVFVHLIFTKKNVSLIFILYTYHAVGAFG